MTNMRDRIASQLMMLMCCNFAVLLDIGIGTTLWNKIGYIWSAQLMSGCGLDNLAICSDEFIRTPDRLSEWTKLRNRWNLTCSCPGQCGTQHRRDNWNFTCIDDDTCLGVRDFRHFRGNPYICRAIVVTIANQTIQLHRTRHVYTTNRS